MSKMESSKGKGENNWLICPYTYVLNTTDFQHLHKIIHSFTQTSFYHMLALCWALRCQIIPFMECLFCTSKYFTFIEQIFEGLQCIVFGAGVVMPRRDVVPMLIQWVDGQNIKNISKPITGFKMQIR